MHPNLDEHVDYKEYFLGRVASARVSEDRLTGLCPFHEDTKASFGVNLSTGQWICRANGGCGAGNVIDFHARMLNVSTREAYQDLCRLYHVPMNGNGNGSGPGKKATSPPSKAIPQEVLDLFKDMPEEKWAYLHEKRGWSEEILRKYRIGYNEKQLHSPGNIGPERFTIPVFSEGELVNIRSYKPGAEDFKLLSWSTGSKKKGTWVGYGESRLFPQGILEEARRRNAPVILCEGEPDCLCGLSHGIMCVTQTAGAGTWKDAFNASFKGLEVIIAYDNDEAGRTGAQRVVKHLPLFARSVSILKWPAWMREKEDLTDWFVKHGKSVDDLLALEREEVRAPQGGVKESGANGGGDGIPEAIREINANHAMILLGGRCVIMNEIVDPIFGRPDVSFSQVGDFRNYYANRRHWVASAEGTKSVSVAKLWLESPERRQYKGVVFSPGQEVAEHYNLYKGLAVEPKAGDWSLFADHIREVIASGNDEIFAYIIAWMAHLVQFPGGQRPGTAIVMRGKQGTGKGFFVSQLGALLGNHFLHITNPRQLVGHFNNHLKNALLCFVDEGIWAGDKQAEGVLKGMVTEKYFTIEPKGKDVFTVENHVRLIIASNHNWVVPAGADERRFFVIDVGDTHIQNRPHFAAIQAQMDSGGREAMLHDLLGIDLSKFDFGNFPRTEALFDQQLYTMSSAQKFWFHLLTAGAITDDCTEWPDFVSTQGFYNKYLEFCRWIGERYPLTDAILVRDLGKIVPYLHRFRPNMNGKRVQSLRLPPLQECREHFQKVLKVKHIDWGDDPYGIVPKGLEEKG